jgi:phage terminase large subunit-like protein
MIHDLRDYPTAGPHFAAFMHAYCRHTKGRWAGTPVDLEHWQAEMLDEAFRLDSNGKRVYTTVLVGIPRKNGKSTIGAGVGLYLCAADGEQGPEVIIASGSRDQADVVFGQARGYVDGSEELAEWFVAGKLVIRLKHAEGWIKRIAADGKLQHGLNPSGVVFDELHAVTTPRQEELWAAMVTASGAREQPLTFVITTAGHDKRTILGKLYDGALKSATAEVERRPGLTIVRDPDAGFLMWWYGITEEQDAALDWDDETSWLPAVLEANPASWIDADYLRRQRHSPTVSLGDFKRLHANVWTQAKESWFPTGAWEALAKPGLAIPDGAPVWVGVDVGLAHDSTAIALAWRHSELEDAEPIIGLEARVWASRQDTIAHEYVAGGRFDLRIAEDYIADLAGRYAVRAVVFDERFFEGPAQNLDRAGLVVIPVPQSSATMAAAWQTFYQAVREARVVHNGDPVFAAHVGSVAAEMTERGWRIRKLKSTQKIDAVPASAMAHYYAQRGEEPASHPYESRGLLVL